MLFPVAPRREQITGEDLRDFLDAAKAIRKMYLYGMTNDKKIALANAIVRDVLDSPHRASILLEILATIPSEYRPGFLKTLSGADLRITTKTVRHIRDVADGVEFEHYPDESTEDIEGSD